MTISSTTNRVSYTGNGVTTAFSFPYAFHSTADLVVVETVIATGVQTTKALTTHYTISGTTDAQGFYQSGGTVTAVTAPASTVTWTIYRDPAITQGAELVENDALPVKAGVESPLDRLTMIAQRLKDRLDRSLQLPEGDTSGATVEIPSEVDRAGKLLYFDEDGNVSVVDPVAIGATVTPTFNTLTVNGLCIFGDAAADEVRYNAGVFTLVNNVAETRAIGTAVAGATTARQELTTFSGHSGGTSDVIGKQVQILSSGASNVASSRALIVQNEVTATGTNTFANAVSGYIRAGLAGVGTVPITNARAVDFHIANEGNGNITNAVVYQAGDVDLQDGTGLIASMSGLRVGNIGHATRISTLAAGVFVGDCTAGATRTSAFYSEMATGTGKRFLDGNGSAPSTIQGAVAIGKTTVPTDILEATGYVKLSGDGTINAAGSNHEMRSANATFIVLLHNTHASTPHGFDLKFTGSSPDNNTQIFARFQDATTARCLIYSDGDLQNHDNSYGAISDANVKDAITDARSQLDDFRRLKFRNYKHKDDIEQYGAAAKEQIGLVAQEVLDVSPGLVLTITRQERQHGAVTIDGQEHSYDHVRDVPSFAVQYSVLAVKNAKATQELIAVTDDHERRLRALEQRSSH